MNLHPGDQSTWVNKGNSWFLNYFLDKSHLCPGSIMHRIIKAQSDLPFSEMPLQQQMPAFTLLIQGHSLFCQFCPWLPCNVSLSSRDKIVNHPAFPKGNLGSSVILWYLNLWVQPRGCTIQKQYNWISFHQPARACCLSLIRANVFVKGFRNHILMSLSR